MARRWLSFKGSEPVVTALPSSPVHGQECLFQTSAMATAGVSPWRLRYNANSSSSYKWEVISAIPLHSEVGTNFTTTSTSQVAITGGPSITLPLAGDYDCQWGGRVYNTNAVGASCQLILNGSVAGSMSLTDTYQGQAGTVTSVASNVTRRVRATGLAIQTLALYALVNGGTGNFEQRWLSVTPIRVG